MPSSKDSGAGLKVACGGEAVFAGVTVNAGVDTGVAVAVAVAVAVGVGVGVGVDITIGVCVAVGVEFGIEVGVGVDVGAGVAVDGCRWHWQKHKAAKPSAAVVMPFLAKHVASAATNLLCLTARLPERPYPAHGWDSRPKKSNNSRRVYALEFGHYLVRRSLSVK